MVSWILNWCESNAWMTDANNDNWKWEGAKDDFRMADLTVL